MAELKQDVVVGFTMADPEGTAPLRVVGGHAVRLGEIWTDLGNQFQTLADSLDALVAGASKSDEAGD